MRRRLLIVASALLAGASLLTAIDACTIVNGLTVPGDAATTDGADASGDSGPLDPCEHARPPPKPSGPDLPGDQTITVVVSRFGVGIGDGGTAPGFDLDNACSCPPAVPETCVGRKDHCDTLGGRDNATGTLFNTLLAAPTASKLDFEARINNAVRAGGNTILFRVTGFNGTVDDPDVLVSVYSSPGLFDGSGANVRPTFTENEQWALDDRQFPVSPSVPRATTAGYVARGKLVATLDVTLDLGDSFSVALKGGIVQADISLNGNAGKPTITGGVLAGRWPIADALRVAGRVRLEDGGKLVCENALAYATVKDIICQEADLVSDRARDSTGAACDSLSAAILFQAAPASLGPLKTAIVENDCPDAGGDDCTKDGGR